MSPKRGPGRPELPKRDALGKLFAVRLTPAELRAIKAASDKEAMSPSQWARNVLLNSAEAHMNETQTVESGRRADQWGRVTARRLAGKLGATGLTGASNECVLPSGERVVIKCANPDTTSVGVSHAMLERLDKIIGAFARQDGTFDLWSLTPDQYRDAMRPTASKGPSANRVSLVNRRHFESVGQPLGQVAP